MNARTEFNTPATLRPIREIVAEYEEKRDAAEGVEIAFSNAVKQVELAANIGGAYGGSVWSRAAPDARANQLKAVLLRSAWQHIYDGLNIKKIAPATDRKRFDLTLENPPEFTLENIAATFGDYLKDPRQHILRGLAEVFCDLDSSYKSHSKVKIGVDGLPKRIILSGFGEYSYGSYGQEKLLDVFNALANYTGKPQLHSGHISDMTRGARKHGSVMWWGGELRVFKNGNAHLIFDKPTLREINLALAEFYGETLYDDTGNNQDDGPLFRTDVAKDLQFYWTPKQTAQKVLGEIDFSARHGQEPEPMTILEPSCGEGHLMDEIVSIVRDPEARFNSRPVIITGVEHDHERAETARSKGHRVVRANFLDTAADPRFDVVIMNPPFNQWRKHLTHARKFLKPRPEGQRWGGGKLICILPATAFYDGRLGEMGLVRADAHTKENGWRDTGWHDLPVASFAEAGTNVPTGYLVLDA